jgi:hypothetical protein
MLTQSLIFLLLVDTVAYLIISMLTLEAIRRNEPTYWMQIGSPRLWSPIDQVKVFWRVICGAELRDSIITDYGGRLKIVRILFVLSLALVVAVSVTTK